MSEIIPSPCISLCMLDNNDICVGCFRTEKEIREWMACENDKKREILAKCRERSLQAKRHSLK